MKCHHGVRSAIQITHIEAVKQVQNRLGWQGWLTGLEIIDHDTNSNEFFH